MTEYLQFSLMDMTPYNRQSWFNLVAEYNQAIWFVYPIAIVIILLMVKLRFKSSNKVNQHQSVKWILAFLGLSWVWIGAVFHLQYYANLNWAAPWFGGLFILQGCLLIMIAIFIKSASLVSFSSLRGGLSLLLILVGVFVYPLSLLFEGRSFSQLEWFPLHPTPVLLVSFALCILLKTQWRHALVIIPVVWSIISAAFAISLGLLELYFIAAALLIWLTHFLIALFSNQNGKTD